MGAAILAGAALILKAIAILGSILQAVASDPTSERREANALPKTSLVRSSHPWLLLGVQGDREGLEARLHVVRKLHSEGLIDREVADQLDIHPASAARLRTRLGLRPNGHARRRRPQAWQPDRDARFLYEQGLNDREIAEKLGVSRESVTKWRQENRLLAVGKPGPKPR